MGKGLSLKMILLRMMSVSTTFLSGALNRSTPNGVSNSTTVPNSLCFLPIYIVAFVPSTHNSPNRTSLSPMSLASWSACTFEISRSPCISNNTFPCGVHTVVAPSASASSCSFVMCTLGMWYS